MSMLSNTAVKAILTSYGIEQGVSQSCYFYPHRLPDEVDLLSDSWHYWQTHRMEPSTRRVAFLLASETGYAAWIVETTDWHQANAARLAKLTDELGDITLTELLAHPQAVICLRGLFNEVTVYYLKAESLDTLLTPLQKAYSNSEVQLQPLPEDAKLPIVFTECLLQLLFTGQITAVNVQGAYQAQRLRCQHILLRQLEQDSSTESALTPLLQSLWKYALVQEKRNKFTIQQASLAELANILAQDKYAKQLIYRQDPTVSECVAKLGLNLLAELTQQADKLGYLVQVCAQQQQVLSNWEQLIWQRRQQLTQSWNGYLWANAALLWQAVYNSTWIGFAAEFSHWLGKPVIDSLARQPLPNRLKNISKLSLHHTLNAIGFASDTAEQRFDHYCQASTVKTGLRYLGGGIGFWLAMSAGPYHLAKSLTIMLLSQQFGNAAYRLDDAAATVKIKFIWPSAAMASRLSLLVFAAIEMAVLGHPRALQQVISGLVGSVSLTVLLQRLVPSLGAAHELLTESQQLGLSCLSIVGWQGGLQGLQLYDSYAFSYDQCQKAALSFTQTMREQGTAVRQADCQASLWSPRFWLQQNSRLKLAWVDRGARHITAHCEVDPQLHQVMCTEDSRQLSIGWR